MIPFYFNLSSSHCYCFWNIFVIKSVYLLLVTIGQIQEEDRSEIHKTKKNSRWRVVLTKSRDEDGSEVYFVRTVYDISRSEAIKKRTPKLSRESFIEI